MRFSTIGFALCFVTAAACGGGDDDDPGSYNCADEARDDEFVAGIAKQGESQRMMFTLVSADPAPPARGDNVWMLKLTTMAAPGTPVDGAVMSASPFMPDHNHGPQFDTVITPAGEPGLYRLEPVNLWMPGLWETTIRVSGADSDRAVFRFCLSS